MLFTSGYARSALVHQGRIDQGVELIPKPFLVADLAARSRVLDAADLGMRRKVWCPRSDSNRHFLRNSILSRARLPIPPQGHVQAPLARNDGTTGKHVRSRFIESGGMANGPQKAPEPRKGMPSVQLDEEEFLDRFKSQFAIPRSTRRRSAGQGRGHCLARLQGRPQVAAQPHKAGQGYADPDYELGDDWRDAKAAIEQAQREYDDPAQPPCILIVNGSSRSEHTCPGEMSKSWRLTEIAREICGVDGVETRVLNLSRLAAEYGARSTPAKRASRPPPRSATGRAAATPIIRWARPRT